MNTVVHKTTLGITLLTIFALIGMGYVPVLTHASTISKIQSQIETKREARLKLQDEIARYQKQLDALGSKQSTLESTIRSLTFSRRKLNAVLDVTQNKIDTANLKLKQLGNNIDTTQKTIDQNNSAIALSLRIIDQNDITAESPLALVFKTNGLADAWKTADRLVQFNEALNNNVRELTKAKKTLASVKEQVHATKQQLVSLHNKQISERKSIDANSATQRKLLRRTKNKESAYQKLIADKKSSEKSFEQELQLLQSKLNLIVNPGTLPKAGSGILAWPFSNSFMHACTKRKRTFGNLDCITQYFGNTPFSTANPQVYNGHGHNAIDIAAPIGTPVHATLTGKVLDTGDTDLSHDAKGRQCWSFGKWIMLIHPNGINTMYAHLSKIEVTKGQKVATGQIIGYSGMTGYATGPHIHFGVYASDGTKIMTLGKFHDVSGTRCANAKMPVAKIKAYLNPLSYLPR